MKKKNTITIVLVLAVVVLTLAFGSQSPSVRKWLSFAPQARAQSASQIPSNALYDMMFRTIISFRRKAEIQILKGESAPSLHNYFKAEAGLTDRENEVLQQVAIEFLQEVQPLDDQAIRLIAQYKRAFSEGEIPAGQEVPKPPQELAPLQEQREALVWRYRDRLREMLGEDRFGEFDNFVQGTFAVNFRSIEVTQN
jgi:hypothetical protein